MSSELLDWSEKFVRNKDLILKKIESLSFFDTGFVCNHKDGSKRTYIISENLESAKELENTTFICLNTKNNVNYLAKNWERFIGSKTCSIVFANPKTNNQWTIFPYTHNRFCDPKTLKTGLKSLYTSVEAADG